MKKLSPVLFILAALSFKQIHIFAHSSIDHIKSINSGTTEFVGREQAIISNPSRITQFTTNLKNNIIAVGREIKYTLGGKVTGFHPGEQKTLQKQVEALKKNYRIPSDVHTALQMRLNEISNPTHITNRTTINEFKNQLNTIKKHKTGWLDDRTAWNRKNTNNQDDKNYLDYVSMQIKKTNPSYAKQGAAAIKIAKNTTVNTLITTGRALKHITVGGVTGFHPGEKEAIINKFNFERSTFGDHSQFADNKEHGLIPFKALDAITPQTPRKDVNYVIKNINTIFKETTLDGKIKNATAQQSNPDYEQAIKNLKNFITTQTKTNELQKKAIKNFNKNLNELNSYEEGRLFFSDDEEF